MAKDKNQFDKLDYLQSVIDGITDIITILEANGTIRYESPSITPLLGYTPEEMAGKNAFSFIHPEDYPRIFQLFTATIVQKGKIEKTELRFKHKDGSWRYLECSAKNLLFDSNVHGVVISSRDISSRRENEAQIRLQANALHAAFNGILITDVAGNMLWANDAVTRLTGYPFDELKGKNPRIFKSGEQKPEVYKELWDTILSGRAWEGEMINRRKDGMLYFERKIITPVKDSGGKITHFIAVMHDISSEKKLEAQFRQAQKMEAVGRLAGGVAHDFNNLLTVILGHSDILLGRLDAADPTRNSISEIRTAALRAASLTRQLLAFSRKQVLQSKVLDLNEIVRGADKMIRRLLGEDVELVTIFGEKLRSVKVDAFQIEQVIMNLAVNARDAMPKGGKLVIETSNVTVDAKAAAVYQGFQPGEYVQLKVKDSGEGMPPEVKAHLFEPFFTTKEKGKGTGLGLATVYGIVKQSQGYVYVDSEPGKGAEFKVYLPPAGEQAAAEHVETAVKLPVGNETVLIAEDEDLLRGLAVQMLSRQGFQVLEARNGLEALRLIREREDSKKPPVEMLITDMVMPYMGGGELAEKFSKMFPKSKIIFTSGYTDHNSVQKWIDQGCKFIQKPYTQAEMLMTVREVLDKK